VVVHQARISKICSRTMVLVHGNGSSWTLSSNPLHIEHRAWAISCRVRRRCIDSSTRGGGIAQELCHLHQRGASTRRYLQRRRRSSGEWGYVCFGTLLPWSTVCVTYLTCVEISLHELGKARMVPFRGFSSVVAPSLGACGLFIFKALISFL
jgi:hypothetical protein